MTKLLLSEMKHPRQPIGYAPDESVRFKQNMIVRWMLDAGRDGKKFNLNDIRDQMCDVKKDGFSFDDLVQLDQLIGYTVSGFGELSYVPVKFVEECDAEACRVIEESKKTE